MSAVLNRRTPEFAELRAAVPRCSVGQLPTKRQTADAWASFEQEAQPVRCRMARAASRRETPLLLSLSALLSMSALLSLPLPLPLPPEFAEPVAAIPRCSLGQLLAAGLSPTCCAKPPLQAPAAQPAVPHAGHQPAMPAQFAEPSAASRRCSVGWLLAARQTQSA